MRPMDPVRKRMSVGGQNTGGGTPRGGGGTPRGGNAQELINSLSAEKNVIAYIKDSSGARPSENAVCLRTQTDNKVEEGHTFHEKGRIAEGTGTDAKQLCEELNKAGIAVTCMKGMKPGSQNQDSFGLVIQDKAFKLFAVFDGHGPAGHDVSQFAVEKLFKHFLQHKDRDTNTKQALTEGFLSVQKMLAHSASQGSIQANDSGSTATLAYLPAGKNVAHIAHIGDSRAMLGWTDPSKGPQYRELTEDHKPDKPEEKKRIEAAGGVVVFDGYFNHRIYSKDGKGGLNMSRAFGDCAVHRFGVTAEPEYMQVDIGSNMKDPYLIICSDGVWEFMKDKDVDGMVRKHGLDKVKAAADEIAKNAYDLWMEDSENEVSDDISVCLAYL